MVRPSVEAGSVSIIQGPAEEKRRRGGALLQNLADDRGRVGVAIASWTAGVLSRFPDGLALLRQPLLPVLGEFIHVLLGDGNQRTNVSGAGRVFFEVDLVDQVFD